MKRSIRIAACFIACGCSLNSLRAEPRPLTASEVVENGQVGAFEHGTFPSLGNTTHPGVDIVADCGNAVSAWQDGTVVDVVSDPADRNFNSLGYMVMIDHGTLPSLGKRTFSLYLHLQAPPKLDGRDDLAVGTSVARGTRIGEIGKTGVATGCHLHFETRHFASRFHPDWLNIYGKGDKRRSSEFLADWVDPKVATFGKQALNPSQPVLDPGASGEEARVWVTAAANVRSKASTSGSQVLATRTAGSLMSGSWVPGDDGKSRWLKVELAAMEVHSPLGPFGYVWEGNLRSANDNGGEPAMAQRPIAPVTPAQMPQLRMGAYVAFPTRCAQASNATLEWWNGQFFSGGRKHAAYPRAVAPARANGSQPFVADVKGWEDNKTYSVSFLVLSQSMYERDGLRYFHCADAKLPPTWRGSTPPQTPAPRPPVVAPATAGQVDFASYTNPEVGRAFSVSSDVNLWKLVRAAVPDQRLLTRIRDDVGVTLPPEVSGGRLLLWNKCTNLCRDFFSNTIVLAQGANGQTALVCVYESTNNRSGTARWFQRGKVVRQTRGECPNKLDQIPLSSTSQATVPKPTLAKADMAFMNERHVSPLANFLKANPLIRLAQTSDFWEWDRVSSEIRGQYSNSHPYYAVGDFNRDRFEDFAVVLVDMTIGAMPRNYEGNGSKYYNASVAVFNGSDIGYNNYPNFIEKWGVVQSNLLLYSYETNDLMVGQWQGSLAQVKPERNGKYRYYFGE